MGRQHASTGHPFWCHHQGQKKGGKDAGRTHEGTGEGRGRPGSPGDARQRLLPLLARG